ncbi:MAG: hypothetical protein JSW58_17090 [Candidatus Latescibacterota bacterium]|nr:MAG: hypothetical protein JSW58_17090 [Candidatus Latescibacterota bacterium]
MILHSRAIKHSVLFPSLVLVPILLLWVRGSSRLDEAELSVTIKLISQTQRHSYDPYHSPTTIGRVIHTDKRFSSHKIIASVKVDNVRRDPCTFTFKWYDPDGNIIDKTEHRRPDPDPSVRYRGHWSMYPIVHELEFKGRTAGKYTFVVERPEGNVLGERSFNFSLRSDQEGNILSRNSKTVLIIAIGVVVVGLVVATSRVFS